VHLLTTTIPRGIAIALGGAAALDGAAALLTSGGSVGLLNPLLHGGPAPAAASLGLSAITMIAGGALAAVAVSIAPGNALRSIGIIAAGLLATIAATDSAAHLMRSGSLNCSPFPPMALVVLAAAMTALISCVRRQTPDTHRAALRHSVAAAACAPILLIAGLLLLMLTDGRIDARRPADAVVVLGARAYKDGRPSDALADRLRTACALFHGGYAPLLIMSGGPGDGAIHEAEAMRRFAIEHGVPESAIMLDPMGVNTDGTVEGTLRILEHLHGSASPPRILAVSHAYHLPRVRLAYRRAGLHVHPVPAHESYILTRMPYFMLRESAALIITYMRGLQDDGSVFSKKDQT